MPVWSQRSFQKLFISCSSPTNRAHLYHNFTCFGSDRELTSSILHYIHPNSPVAKCWIFFYWGTLRFPLQVICLTSSWNKSKEEDQDQKMQQRRNASGRPTGTDGSDFSYRMVVESRKWSFEISYFFQLYLSIKLLVFFSVRNSEWSHQVMELYFISFHNQW